MKKPILLLCGLLLCALFVHQALAFKGMGSNRIAPNVYTNDVTFGQSNGSTNSINFYGGSGQITNTVTYNGYSTLSTGSLSFSNSSSNNTTPDTILARTSANVLGAYQGDQATFGDFKARSLIYTPVYGSELAPALTAGNWTVGAGWESPIVGPGLIKNADGTGTQTPSAATTIVAGSTYKVVITLSAASVGSASYTLGGVTGGSSLAAATTYTDYITTTTTGKLIITPTNTSRFTISAISYKAVTGGLAGTTTNDLAPAGNIGEIFSSLVANGAPVSLTTNTTANVTSLSLTAGDWDVDGNVNAALSSATETAMSGGITTTSATVPADGSEVYSGVVVTTTSLFSTMTAPRKRISIASPTTVYLVARATFSAGTVSVFGALTARRVR